MTTEGSRSHEVIGEAFNDAIPADADPNLKAQSATFQGYFKDKAKKDQVIDFSYAPGVGVTITQDGQQLGPPPTGKEFTRGLLVDLLWSEDLLCGRQRADSPELRVARRCGPSRRLCRGAGIAPGSLTVACSLAKTRWPSSASRAREGV